MSPLLCAWIEFLQIRQRALLSSDIPAVSDSSFKRLSKFPFSERKRRARWKFQPLSRHIILLIRELEFSSERKKLCPNSDDMTGFSSTYSMLSDWKEGLEMHPQFMVKFEARSDSQKPNELKYKVSRYSGIHDFF